MFSMAFEVETPLHLKFDFVLFVVPVVASVTTEVLCRGAFSIHLL